jgi:hypothetical protein
MLSKANRLIMMNVVRLCVIMLNVLMLSVVTPRMEHQNAATLL